MIFKFEKLIYLYILIFNSIINAQVVNISFKHKVDNTQLIPEDRYSKKDNSNNVIQGIAVCKKYYITTQAVRKHHSDKAVLFNIYDNNGTSLANYELLFATHAYDLSCELKDNNHLYLYTVGEHQNNMLRFLLTIPNGIDKKLNIKLDNKYKLPSENYASTGITLSNNYKYILAISRNYIKKNHKIIVTSGHINIYDKNSILNGNNHIVNTINMVDKQKSLPVQGIFMFNNTIFTLSGNNKVSDKKYLFVYSKNGKLIDTYNILASKQDIKRWKKWELEGLSIKNGWLITTINARDKYKNTYKYILKILPLTY